MVEQPSEVVVSQVIPLWVYEQRLLSVVTTLSVVQKIVGTTVSSTVTKAEHVSTFPLVSVTVKTTVFVTGLLPKLVQSKSVLSIAKLAIPHASLEPLSISAATIVASPEASNWIVISWQTTVGATKSWTVTIAVQVSELPAGSVTVNVTTFSPISVQSKILGVAVLTKVLKQLS